ncbi:MAG: UDP-2,4-diacetamido-2,4,6-trideoxy-beta-L-altropyranose hydrolase [Bryobacteraceae bacterium]
MRLLVRVDASPQIGAGHLMRCIAASEAWREAGGEVEFLTRCSNSNLLDQVTKSGASVTPLEAQGSDWQTLESLGQNGQLLLLDGYHFDSEYQKRVKDYGFKLAVIDDMAKLPHYYADVILNQNILASRLRYPREPGARLLLGTPYVLLRNEFRRLKMGERRVPDMARRLLITMGGSDPANFTVKAIQGVKRLSADMEVMVIVGAENAHLAELSEEIAGCPHIRLATAVGDMPGYMQWADLAFTGAGSTCWELAFMRVPMIAVVLAENQKPIASGLGEIGLAVNLGHHSAVSPHQIASAISDLAPSQPRRAKMALRGAELIDGQGARRFADVLQSVM